MQETGRRSRKWRDNDMKLDRYLLNIVIKNLLARCVLLFSLSLSICIDYDGVQNRRCAGHVIKQALPGGQVQTPLGPGDKAWRKEQERKGGVQGFEFCWRL